MEKHLCCKAWLIAAETRALTRGTVQGFASGQTHLEATLLCCKIPSHRPGALGCHGEAGSIPTDQTVLQCREEWKSCKACMLLESFGWAPGRLVVRKRRRSRKEEKNEPKPHPTVFLVL